MEQISFEEAFERLEASIAALQDGKLPLEESLQHYQEGMQLLRHCNELLQQAELSVQQLSVDAIGTITAQPVDL
ncbi:exodeoxyribonuclease VII small subunit [Tengunoibacter tsumagoiensis]|uniref:Exodeoxyribonuclease 7 small subunit n=1 Tax=Tengunoibacter tsumagoiensis TaxID=2014871 RepID=A0A401ZY14_9CHLR|nr:exodeoxyribonuclease VII small subunit [Tengunoibacter tsumagoiensis]GCE11730.1 exodeoxyribonuclease 7 small subunit [Tengunoibacter tsumagoiensis]